MLSMPCWITLEGLLLAPTNQVLIVSAASKFCAAPHAVADFKNVTNPQGVTSATETREVFFMGTAGSAPLGPGVNYKICWAHDPTSEDSFRVFVGTFAMYGAAVFS